MNNVSVLCHSSIKITGKYVIYIDPYMINKNYFDADYIFFTHSHYDHFSVDDIKKVINKNTKCIATKDLYEKLLNIDKEKITIVEPNNEYNVNNLHFETVVAYNKEKEFHKKENNWVGYIIETNSLRYYIAGDTDFVDELKDIKCDIALVPVGGHFTMGKEEAANLVNTIMPKVAIPTHYGVVAGKKEDGKDFLKLLDKNIQGRL